MEWIDVTERKPDDLQLCYVIDAKWSGYCFLAFYHEDYDRFVLSEPTIKRPPTLCVTHWVGLPRSFMIN